MARDIRHALSRFRFTPTLVCILLASLADAQTTQSLSLNSLTPVTPDSSSLLYRLPSSSQLSVSVAQCSDSSPPTFYITNDTSIADPGPSSGGDVYQINLKDGYGSWTGTAPNGAVLSATNLGQTPFEIGVTDSEPMHRLADALPWFGDSTSNQAIIFSAPFADIHIDQPQYPNYTLPAASASLPDSPPSLTNFTLVVGDASLTTIPQTGCSLTSAQTAGNITSQQPWVRDEDGWRYQWLVSDLNPSTNYTMYVIQNGTQVSGPLNFVTKSSEFPCPLAHSIPWCSNVAYAVPLPPSPDQDTAFAYTSQNLPDSISTPLLSYMTNFTTMLLTFGCGRDLYSPIQTCANCQRAYHRWLCSTSFPRCTERSPADTGSNEPNAPVSALLPQPSGSPTRNPLFPNASYSYTSLLPCLETCNAADRSCPYFLGFSCPTPQYGANMSYGVGFIDSGDAGVIGEGITGTSQDRWGNVWCGG
ncbi:hypothetical protein CONPUDRAFT_61634 [Coniophora puteana RWD-64-598 SS2]|uniref:FZ domain-containing protein n=1 Tax=Coniophora puteana (strain RWD-64-598) TaxID=741705 RepID=A0A5M3MGP5_CONPW|nr:uncharacterized protein CONPUDRAFT_61634 [Coniophora puteana RWD-64-598 SS2]EIW77795.1 hypothetical protein CONPUDRAFT_61634 [Coniophora puteana RWD-64-598 SS2]